jgi:uncharacterized protein YndB with AHSA1/START domain
VDDLDRLFEQFVIEAEVEVAATPEAVWQVVSDLERMGGFSPECVGIEWLDGPRGAEVGARFVGVNRITRNSLPEHRRNRVGADWSFEWRLPCAIVESDPPRRLSWVVGDRFVGAPASRWTFVLEPSSGGTRLREIFEHVADGKTATRSDADRHPAYAEKIVEERGEVMRGGMTATLAAMKAAIQEAASRPSGGPAVAPEGHHRCGSGPD